MLDNYECTRAIFWWSRQGPHGQIMLEESMKDAIDNYSPKNPHDR